MKSATTKSPSGPTNMRRLVRIHSSGDIKLPMSGSFAKSGGSFMDNGGEDTHALQEKIAYLKEEVQINQESFISRERAYKIRIDELEEALTNKRKEKIGWMDTDPKIGALKKQQALILSNVALVQDRFSRVVREQEQDLLKAFQARLLDVQAELEMQKSKKDDGAVAYIELSKAKEYDVEREKVRADLKERQNQALLQANNRLKSQFASREEDRNYLVGQINLARNDNARLRTEYSEHEAENKRLQAQVKEQAERIGAGAAQTTTSTANRKNLTSAQSLQHKIDTEERYKEVNARLRKLLAEERRSMLQVRANYQNEINSRTELEMLLRDCVEEVRREGERRRTEYAKFATKKVPQYDENDPETQRRDRERVLELLLSKEQVVALIYAKSGVAASAALPVPMSPTKASFGVSGSPNANMDGVVNGLLDLNFGTNPTWTSGTAESNNLMNHSEIGNNNETDTAREENQMEKLPPLVPPGRK